MRILLVTSRSADMQEIETTSRQKALSRQQKEGNNALLVEC